MTQLDDQTKSNQKESLSNEIDKLTETLGFEQEYVQEVELDVNSTEKLGFEQESGTESDPESDQEAELCDQTNSIQKDKLSAEIEKLNDSLGVAQESGKPISKNIWSMKNL